MDKSGTPAFAVAKVFHDCQSKDEQGRNYVHLRTLILYGGIYVDCMIGLDLARQQAENHIRNSGRYEVLPDDKVILKG